MTELAAWLGEYADAAGSVAVQVLIGLAVAILIAGAMWLLGEIVAAATERAAGGIRWMFRGGKD